MPHIICAGVITVDTVLHLDSFPAPGIKHRAKSSLMTVGGCALNAALAITALGGKASLAGAVRNELRHLGVCDDLLVTIPGQQTARSSVIVTRDGERTIINYRSDELFEVDLPATEPREFDAVLVDTRWLRGASQLIEIAIQNDKVSVIDAESPLAGLDNLLSKASHVAFSEQGFSDYADIVNEDNIAKVAKQLGNWTCVTQGPNPVLCHDGTTLIEIPTYRVKAVDTLGAGDVWHGAFTLALARYQLPKKLNNC